MECPNHVENMCDALKKLTADRDALKVENTRLREVAKGVRPLLDEISAVMVGEYGRNWADYGHLAGAWLDMECALDALEADRG